MSEEVLAQIKWAISGLLILSSNPSFGGNNSGNLIKLREYLQVLALLMEEGEEQVEELKKFTNEIQLMVKEDRGPTTEEITQLRDRHAKASERLEQAVVNQWPPTEETESTSTEETEEDAPSTDV